MVKILTIALAFAALFVAEVKIAAEIE